MLSWIIYSIGRTLCAIFFHCYLFTEVKGQNHIPRKGGFILAGNHASYLDPVAFGVACPRFLNYMARDTLFRNPFFGWVLRHVGSFPLRRNFADLGAIKEALKRLGEGKGLLLFPEGTRSATGEMAGGLEGVGFLARKGNVPVIPAYVIGTDKAMPKGSKFIKPTRLKVIFGEVLVFPQETPLSDKEMTVQIMRRIAALKDLC
jgi:1-acyl-sn-glycerol-3-phosphate acyltransferase